MFDAAIEAALARAKTLYVATERKDGSRSDAKPIWFVLEDDAILFTTVPASWKAKRVRLGRPLHVNVGGPSGPYLKGRGTLLTDPDLAARMGPVYARRYWLAWLGFFRPRPERVRAGKTVIVRVTPWDTDSSA